MAPTDGFDAFVGARQQRAQRAAYLLTRDWQLAEDLLQTSLTKLWLAWSRVDDPDAYLWRTMTHTYTSWWRRKWRGEVPTDLAPDNLPQAGSTGRAPRAAIDDAIGQIDLWRALATLPRRQRAVLVLRFFLDLSTTQTAATMDCSEGTVKSQTSKALAKLRLDPKLAERTEAQPSQTQPPDAIGMTPVDPGLRTGGDRP